MEQCGFGCYRALRGDLVLWTLDDSSYECAAFSGTLVAQYTNNAFSAALPSHLIAWEMPFAMRCLRTVSKGYERENHTHKGTNKNRKVPRLREMFARKQAYAVAPEPACQMKMSLATATKILLFPARDDQDHALDGLGASSHQHPHKSASGVHRHWASSLSRSNPLGLDKASLPQTCTSPPFIRRRVLRSPHAAL